MLDNVRTRGSAIGSQHSDQFSRNAQAVLRFRASQPIGKTRRAEPRVGASGDQALVVHRRAEVAGGWVGGYFARVALRGEVLADEVVHADGVGAGDFDRGVERLAGG